MLITGASCYMGRVTALTFAHEDANLAICTSKRTAELNTLADAAHAPGVNVVKSTLTRIGFARDH